MTDQLVSRDTGGKGLSVFVVSKYVAELSQNPCRQMVLLSCFLLHILYFPVWTIQTRHKPLSPTASAISPNDLSSFARSTVKPQISHFINFTPCEELVPRRNFWQMWNLRMVKFDNFRGLKSVLTEISHFCVFDVWRICAFSSYVWRSGTIFLRCEEMVPIFHKCEELVLNRYMCQGHILKYHICKVLFIIWLCLYPPCFFYCLHEC